MGNLKSPGARPLRTICEVHREIYDVIEFDNSKKARKIKELLEEAFEMGKNISRKLYGFRGKKWVRELAPLNINRLRSMEKRKHRR